MARVDIEAKSAEAEADLVSQNGLPWDQFAKHHGDHRYYKEKNTVNGTEVSLYCPKHKARSAWVSTQS